MKNGGALLIFHNIFINNNKNKQQQQKTKKKKRYFSISISNCNVTSYQISRVDKKKLNKNKLILKYYVRLILESWRKKLPHF